MSELKDFYSVVADAADQFDAARPADLRRVGTRRRRIRHGVVSGLAAVLVVATVGVVTVAANQSAKPSPATSTAPSSSPKPRVALGPLRIVGDGIPFRSAARVTSSATAASGNRGYVVWRAQTTNVLMIGAVDLRTGAQLWSQPTSATGYWESLAVVGDVLIAVVRGAEEANSVPAQTRGFDAATGDQLWQLANRPIITETTVIIESSGKIIGHNVRTGREAWRISSSMAITEMQSATDRRFGNGLTVRADSRFGIASADGGWQVYDGTTGKPIGPRADLGLDWDPKLATDGTLYISVSSSAERNYTIKAVRDGLIVPIHTGTGVNFYLDACWPQRICLTEVRRANEGEIAAFDTATWQQLWRTPLTVLGTMMPAGNVIVISEPGHDDHGAEVAAFEERGRQVHLETLPATAAFLLQSGGDALFLSATGAAGSERSMVRGLNTADGSTVVLGQIIANGPSCSATESRLLCIGEAGATVWNIRAE